MTSLSYVLLADGGRDRALRHVLDWAIRTADPSLAIEGFTFVKRDGPVADAIRRTVERYRPEFLFVHRDAEREPCEVRRAEIPTSPGRVVRVVPVRMTEAWLLIDEAAIRRAAGNPNGNAPLDLPTPVRVEGLADPKQVLLDAMLTASGALRGRRRKRALRDEAEWCERVAARVADFAPLADLPAFKAFDAELRERLREWRASVVKKSRHRRGPRLPFRSEPRRAD